VDPEVRPYVLKSPEPDLSQVLASTGLAYKSPINGVTTGGNLLNILDLYHNYYYDIAFSGNELKKS
jgi:hypothetical protein